MIDEFIDDDNFFAYQTSLRNRALLLFEMNFKMLNCNEDLLLLRLKKTIKILA